MRRIKASVFLSLDGVMQAPGGPGEDDDGGFSLGGWLPPLGDEGVFAAVGTAFSPPYALLLGRRTYDIFAGHWPFVEGDEAAFGQALTAADKYVVTHRTDPLPWANSHRLDSIDAVSALKATDGPDLLIQGSTTLFPPLFAAGLIDRLTTLTFPVVLGGGKRLFGDRTPPIEMRLIEQQVTPNGVIVAHYDPVGPARTGHFPGHEPKD